MALTEKQKRFVEEYLVDLNATQAAIRAGYSKNRASELGYQLLQKTTVQSAIQDAMARRSQRMEITQDRVIQELARVAFANGTDFAKVVSEEVPVTTVDDEGNLQEAVRRIQRVELVDTDSVDPEKRAAIAGIKEGKHGIEVKSYDKIRALELLGQHLGLFSGNGSGAAGQNEREDDPLSKSLKEYAKELDGRAE